MREGKDWPDAWKPKDRTYEVTLRDEWFEKPVHVLRARTQVVFSNHSPEHCNLHGYLQPDREKAISSAARAASGDTSRFIASRRVVALRPSMWGAVAKFKPTPMMA